VFEVTARWPLACFLAMGLFWGTWAALLPEIKTQVGASDGELGLAMVAAGVGSLPAMIMTGRLWRRLGWWLMPVTAIAFALSALGPIVASTPLALGVALFFIGASSGALDVSMNSAVSDVEVTQNRRLMYGAHALFSLAVFVASIGTGLARQAGVASGPPLVASAIAFVIVAAGTVTVARVLGPARPGMEKASTPISPRIVRAIAALAFLCALSFLIEDAIQNWSALLLEAEIGTGPAIGGAGPGVFAGAMFVGRSAGQWLGGRFSDRALLTSGALVAAAGLLLSATATVAAVALVGLGIGGAGVALVAPALFARAGRLADQHSRGAAIATLTTFGYLGFLVGPVIMGGVAELGGLRLAFVTMTSLALVLAVAGFVTLRSPRPARVAIGQELLRTGRG
jgi:MFS family permease